MTGGGCGSEISDDGGKTIRDRKAMKRIQNRIAQRTYRKSVMSLVYNHPEDTV